MCTICGINSLFFHLPALRKQINTDGPYASHQTKSLYTSESVAFGKSTL